MMYFKVVKFIAMIFFLVLVLILSCEYIPLHNFATAKQKNMKLAAITIAVLLAAMTAAGQTNDNNKKVPMFEIQIKLE